MGIRAVYFSKKFKIPLVSIYTTRIPEYASIYFERVFGTKAFSKPLKDITWNFMKFFYDNSSLVLATTPQIKDILKEKVKPPIKIYPRGVDTEKFSPEFRTKHKKIRLIYVGRISAEKNLSLLVDVLKKDIFPNYRNIEMWIIGDGPYKKKMENNLKEAKYTGFLTGKKLSEAMASGDIFVFPSKSETFGQVIIQSMASGVPVIAMKSEGPNNIIKNGKTGFLCKNKKEFSEKIRFLIENSLARKKIGENGIYESKKYDWNKINSELIKKLEKLKKSS